MRRVIALLLVTSATVAPTALAQLPPRLPASIAGVGEVTPPGCDAGAYKIPFSAASDAGEVWVVGRPAAMGVACDAVVYGGPLTFVGAWRPDAGGCIGDLGGSTARICIGPVPHRGVARDVPFKLCPDAHRCFVGLAWMARS